MSIDVFSGKAQFYQARPTYPNECIDYLVEKFNLSQESVIADIGAGTGILSIPFLERGMTVYSVEPNSDMFSELQKNLRNYEKSFCCQSTAEQTTLKDHFCDLIVVGCALHWFDIARFQLECARICKMERVAVLHIYNYFESNKKALSAKDYTDPCIKAANAFFAPLGFEERRFAYELDYDQERFVNEGLSMGYAPLPEDEKFEETVRLLSQSYQKFHGEGNAKFPFLAKCYTKKEDDPFP